MITICYTNQTLYIVLYTFGLIIIFLTVPSLTKK
jgi:hypothetical protein